MVDNVLSGFFNTLNISVPQGSILGPLLFLIFINDMFKSNALLNFLFADDTTALKKGTSIFELGNFVNLELQKLGMWLRANKLAINITKTKIIVFHPKQKKVEDFQFIFNCNDLNSFPDPRLIFPIERINNSQWRK